MNKIKISTLRHTWLIDIDGTILVHNGYLRGEDVVIRKAKLFFDTIPKEDLIILLTSRKIIFKGITEAFLEKNGFRFNQVIYDLPVGERLLINDRKPQGLNTAKSINVNRDTFDDLLIEVDDSI